MSDQPSHPLVLDDSPAKHPSSAHTTIPPPAQLPTPITTLFPRPCVCRILSLPSALLHASLAFFFFPSSHSLTLAILRQGLARAETGLRFTILPPHPPERWDHGPTPSFLLFPHSFSVIILFVLSVFWPSSRPGDARVVHVRGQSLLLPGSFVFGI